MTELQNPLLKRQMTKDQLGQAFTRLGQILRGRQVMGEIAVFGGAAIVLGFEFRNSTRDVDAVVNAGHGQVMAAAQEVERELGLPANWLSEQATSYLSKHEDFEFFKTYPSEGQFGLRVMMAKPEYLLAMKLLAFRLHSADLQDILQLARRLSRTTAEDLLSLLKHYYPDELVTPERVVQIRDLVRQMNAS